MRAAFNSGVMGGVPESFLCKASRMLRCNPAAVAELAARAMTSLAAAVTLLLRAMVSTMGATSGVRLAASALANAAVMLAAGFCEAAPTAALR